MSPPESRRDVLAKAVIRLLEPGNGRSHRCRADELPERLASDAVNSTADELAATITRLADCGQLIRVQRQPYQAYPQYLIHTGDHSYDEVDALAADVCSLLEYHNERFGTEEELRTWLNEAEIEHTEKDLEARPAPVGTHRSTAEAKTRPVALGFTAARVLQSHPGFATNKRGSLGRSTLHC